MAAVHHAMCPLSHARTGKLSHPICFSFTQVVLFFTNRHINSLSDCSALVKILKPSFVYSLLPCNMDERIEKEKEILKAQTMNEGKPEAIAEKIVQGRIGKFFGEICLVDQDFVKDPNKKVSQVLKENDAEVVEFARFEKGEGIEKKEENFAEEVMKQAGI